MKVSLEVNGKSTTVDAPADMPLLWVLRDVLDLKGTKYGCGVGQCGACTVHLKGAPVRSCQLPVSAAQGAQITAAMNANLCRCATYPRIREAIHKAAATSAAKQGAPPATTARPRQAGEPRN